MSGYDRFSDRLIAAEQVDAKQKERYEMEMQRMLNPALTPARRVLAAIFAVVGLLAAVDFGVTSATARMSGDYAGWGRAVLGVMAALTLALAITLGRMAIRGTVDLRRDISTVTKIRWAISLMVSVVAFVIAWADAHYGTGKASAFYAAMGLAFLGACSVLVIKDRVHQSSLNVRQKLLEIELRLAEMSEKLDNRQGQSESK
jgi:hypothetical protein